MPTRSTSIRATHRAVSRRVSPPPRRASLINLVENPASGFRSRCFPAAARANSITRCTTSSSTTFGFGMEIPVGGAESMRRLAFPFESVIDWSWSTRGHSRRGTDHCQRDRFHGLAGIRDVPRRYRALHRYQPGVQIQDPERQKQDQEEKAR